MTLSADDREAQAKWGTSEQSAESRLLRTHCNPEAGVATHAARTGNSGMRPNRLRYAYL